MPTATEDAGSPSAESPLAFDPVLSGVEDGENRDLMGTSEDAPATVSSREEEEDEEEKEEEEDEEGDAGHDNDTSLDVAVTGVELDHTSSASGVVGSAAYLLGLYPFVVELVVSRASGTEGLRRSLTALLSTLQAALPTAKAPEFPAKHQRNDAALAQWCTDMTAFLTAHRDALQASEPWLLMLSEESCESDTKRAQMTAIEFILQPFHFDKSDDFVGEEESDTNGSNGRLDMDGETKNRLENELGQAEAQVLRLRAELGYSLSNHLTARIRDREEEESIEREEEQATEADSSPVPYTLTAADLAILNGGRVPRDKDNEIRATPGQMQSEMTVPIAVGAGEVPGSNQYRTRLVAFFRDKDPAMLPEVDSMLESYAGVEEMLFESLELKYSFLALNPTEI
ncbi:hypothetical protein ATCC90586_007260 [Pythium insidiosum]|nr:hypothetical protein ATCC90586_007260 [Pythium insidiosum]